MSTKENKNKFADQTLAAIEERFHVEILWACEAGSRAWGTDSPDSDFDLRFIYRRKAEDYLRLNPSKDVIEDQTDALWDLLGWDLDKTLKLMADSNPSLYEWLNSPVVYRRTDFADRIQPIADLCFSEERLLQHYYHIAKKNFTPRPDGEALNAKAYLYAVRSVLAALYVMENHAVPPVSLEELMTKMLPSDLVNDVRRLIEIKKSGTLPEILETYPETGAFVEEKMKEIQAYIAGLDEEMENPWPAINEFFVKEIGYQA